MSETQTGWDWLVPTTKDLLRPDEAARFMGTSVDFVYALIDEGKLEAFEPTDREVKRKRVTARSVRLTLAEQALNHPQNFAERMHALLPHLDSASLSRHIAEATRLRSKKLTSL